MALDREKTLQAAQRYVDRKKYDKAVEEYQKIVKEDPKDARTLLKIGDLQARMQAYTDAIATYDRVGQQYAAQGFALKAIAVYKQVRELIRKHAPDLADRYAHIVPKLAEIYTHLGLPSDALAAYDEVATHYQRTGRDREAIEVFRKMVDLDPSNPLPHLRLAEACCRVSDLDPAIAAFWTAAELLLGMERRDDALKVVERILHFRQDPQYARAAAELYLQKATREDGLQALAKLQICFQANPKDLETLALLAQAFSTISAEAKAIEVYKEMARVARDQGRQDLFEQLLAHLQAVAPDDEQVRALRSLPPTSGSVASTSVAPSSAPRSLDESDLEVLEEDANLRAAIEPAIPRAPRPFTASSPDVEVEVRGAMVEPAADGHEHARKAVVDAESFRKLRLYSKAVEALRLALDLDPGSVEIRDKLRVVLEESGDLDGAAQEAVRLAEVYLAHQDHETAQALCYEALQLAPEQLAAHQLLQQLGVAPDMAAETASVSDQAAGSYAGAPLPSYDLEEMGPTAVMGQSAAPPGGVAELDHVDDPFAELDNAPLPWFSLGADDELTNARAHVSYGQFDDSLGVGEYVPSEALGGGGPASYPSEGADQAALYPGPDLGESSAEPYAVLPDPTAYVAEDYGLDDGSAAELPAPTAEVPVEAVEEALEEADFFASRGLYDDACSVLNQQLTRTPNHPLVLERLRELGQLASGESGTIDRSQLGVMGRQPPEPEGGYDLESSLGALDALAAPVESPGQKTTLRDEVNVDEVFARFKEGIRQQVPEADAATHYDLGVAYQGMGLLNDAVREFELAARDADRECNCYAMIGLIGLEQGELDRAEAAYLRGLEAEKKSVEQAMSLYYDLGNIKEMKGQRDEALYYFKMIARRDPGFRDVKDRIAALEPPPAASTTRATSEDDEFDAAFDKLFESS